MDIVSSNPYISLQLWKEQFFFFIFSYVVDEDCDVEFHGEEEALIRLSAPASS